MSLHNELLMLSSGVGNYKFVAMVYGWVLDSKYHI